MSDIKKGVKNYALHKTTPIKGTVQAVSASQDALSEQERYGAVDRNTNSYTILYRMKNSNKEDYNVY